MNRRQRKKKQRQELEGFERELEKVQKKLSELDPDDPKYTDLLRKAKDLQELIDKGSGPKDKIAKSELLKSALYAGAFGITTFLELHGHITLKHPLRRYIALPRFWDKGIK